MSVLVRWSRRHLPYCKNNAKKIGQFVTLWKRGAPGEEIAPFDSTDDVKLVIIAVEDHVYQGQFIFSRQTLLRRKMFSVEGQGGKRAFRVYPPWSRPIANQAVSSQRWQVESFVDCRNIDESTLRRIEHLFSK